LLLTVECIAVGNQLMHCWYSRGHMVFDVKHLILVEYLYTFKGYRNKKISEFPNSDWTELSTKETVRHRQHS